MINNIWGVKFDSEKTDAWFNILSKLKLSGLLSAIQELSLEKHFPPTIKEIGDKYAELKQKMDREKREREIEEQKTELSRLSAGQFRCLICNNTGDVFYEKDTYSFHARCSCTRGRDLNKWSRYQITKGLLWHNPSTNKNEDLYRPDINDIFTEEEIELIKIRNAGDEMEREAMSGHKDRVMEQIVLISDRIGTV